MKAKEKLILDSAIRLFAIKGFHSTSIQEIVDDCGISKGAFYLYFKSKEELLISIFRFYFDQTITQMENTELQPIDSRLKLASYVKIQLENMALHKDFILMFSREQSIPYNHDIGQLIRTMKHTTDQKFQKAIIDLYGDACTPYLIDINYLIHGLLQSFMEPIIMHAELNIQAMTSYFINRLDDLVTGLIHSTDQPLFTKDHLKSFICSGDYKKSTILEKIRSCKELFVGKPEYTHLLITLDVLETEIEAPSPRIPVIQGMLSNLKADNQLIELQKMISTFFKL